VFCIEDTDAKDVCQAQQLDSILAIGFRTPLPNDRYKRSDTVRMFFRA